MFGFKLETGKKTIHKASFEFFFSVKIISLSLPLFETADVKTKTTEIFEREKLTFSKWNYRGFPVVCHPGTSTTGKRKVGTISGCDYQPKFVIFPAAVRPRKWPPIEIWSVLVLTRTIEQRLLSKSMSATDNELEDAVFLSPPEKY